ncbi:uncharacterized protein LOC9645485 [Selaginella moellendorffii]|uniref:uncharacterized protein LOC9645485 n=1 Tax=Selaginella moellendorffii TaxID=88036 RepID=UPI000D1CA741|nr:uncharacterized protein LOC9645485 [Selaginella moellendorffii]|eukprot:XP_024536283.1 uncharacterized protein LOC9645485 [Selaginella moellendorffii]
MHSTHTALSSDMDISLGNGTKVFGATYTRSSLLRATTLAVFKLDTGSCGGRQGFSSLSLPQLVMFTCGSSLVEHLVTLLHSGPSEENLRFSNFIMQMFCQLVNWLTFFCMVCTLSSTIETVLTTIALLSTSTWDLCRIVS